LQSLKQMKSLPGIGAKSGIVLKSNSSIRTVSLPIKPIAIDRILIIFRFKSAEFPIDILIKFYDERNADNVYCRRFYSDGPKKYQYRVSEDQCFTLSEIFDCNKVEFEMGGFHERSEIKMDVQIAAELPRAK
jgi:hypothetical protein